jgi:hypothetical protein
MDEPIKARVQALRSEDTWSIVTQAIIISLVSVVAIFLLHPLLGVRDADGFAYIIGAHSLHEGNGYRDLVGDPLNHWPPGYSLLLSISGNAIRAATNINYCSFGATVGLFYYILRQSTWSWQAALGFSVGLGAGFFRLLANSAHADILTYALFLAALCGLGESRRLLSSLLWALLIPVKLIAVVFLPAAIAADVLVPRRHVRELLYAYVPGVVASGACVAGVLVFNHLTLHEWLPSSYGESTVESLLSGAKQFAFSIPREFLFSWHGTLKSPLPLAAFCVCSLLIGLSLLSLRPAPGRRWYTAYGVLCLVFSALLLLVRAYIPNIRLLGYGVMVLPLGFRPQPWANPIWLLYGVMSLITGIADAMTVNSLGVMDPRYAALAAQVSLKYAGKNPVATNSFHILDLHQSIPSVPVADYNEARHYDKFLWVTLPNYDPAVIAVTPMAPPGSGWCEESKFDGGAMFSRCSAPSSSPN